MMTVKIPKNITHLKCGIFTGICVIPSVAKILAKVILDRVKNTW